MDQHSTQSTSQHGGSQPDSPLSRAVLWLQNSTALDALVAKAQPVMDAVTANPRLRDLLQGRWLGHALHPIVVQVPLGAWLSASVLDLTCSDADSAELLVGVGAAATVPAVLSGLAELSAGDEQEKRVGVVHAVSNAGALALQLGSLAARRRGARTAGAALSLAAMSLASAAAYLGGHLAIAMGMGSHDPAFDSWDTDQA